MSYCNFASTASVIYQGLNPHVSPLNEYGGRTQEEFLSALFYTFTDKKFFQFDMGTSSRFFNNKRTLSSTILNFYYRNFDYLFNDISEYIVSWLSDINDALSKLYDLVHDDEYMNSETKYQLLSYFTDDTSKAAFCIAKIVFYSMYQPKEAPQNAVVPLKNNNQLFIDNAEFNHPVPKKCCHFKGRESEIENLHSLLSEHNHIFVRGIAGIGKSELAKAYAEKYSEDYKNIIYLVYHNDLETTIAELEITGKPKHIAFQEHFKKLQQLTADTLIIIDNFNTTEAAENKLKMMMKLNCRIIFTTRCRFNSVLTFELSEISDIETLLEIVEYFYPETLSNRDTVCEIISILHHHTFAVRLVSALLSKSFLTPDQILAKLKENPVNPVFLDYINTDKDNTYQKSDYYGHIHLLFSLFTLNETMKYTLRCMTFISTEGIPARKIALWLSAENLNAIEDLNEIGLLSLSERNIVSIHPVVKDITRTDLSPSLENCNPFTKNIFDICTQHGTAEADNDFSEILMNICTSSCSEDSEYQLLFMEEAFGYFEQCTLTREMNRLGRIYSDTVNTLSEKSEKHLAKLYWIQSACVGIAQKKYTEAVPYAVKALELADSCGLEFKANMHHNLGFLYYHCNKFKSCITELKKSLAIYGEIGTATHDTIQTINLLNLAEKRLISKNG